MSTNIKLLDGGFGQAIINKGIDQIGTLWGCSAYLNEQDHQKVIDTHLDFINAGSKIITTSNFTIRKRRLAQNKLEDKLNDFLKISGKLAQKAVELSNKKILKTGFKFLHRLEESIEEMIIKWSKQNLIKDLLD